ncbi:MAG: TRAP transporter small permease subunit [Marinobacter sp.]|nr:TRAP transporter small permease subunit [Marinobacter sp.]
MIQPSGLYTFCRRISEGMLMLSILAILVIATLGATNTVMTVVAGKPIPAVIQITKLLVALIIFMTQPFIVLTGAHIAIDLFAFKGRSVLRTIRSFAILALSLLSYSAISVGAWRSMMKKRQLQGSSAAESSESRSTRSRQFCSSAFASRS